MVKAIYILSSNVLNYKTDDALGKAFTEIGFSSAQLVIRIIDLIYLCTMAVSWSLFARLWVSSDANDSVGRDNDGGNVWSRPGIL